MIYKKLGLASRFGQPDTRSYADSIKSNILRILFMFMFIASFSSSVFAVDPCSQKELLVTASPADAQGGQFYFDVVSGDCGDDTDGWYTTEHTFYCCEGAELNISKAQYIVGQYFFKTNGGGYTVVGDEGADITKKYATVTMNCDLTPPHVTVTLNYLYDDECPEVEVISPEDSDPIKWYYRKILIKGAVTEYWPGSGVKNVTTQVSHPYGDWYSPNYEPYMFEMKYNTSSYFWEYLWPSLAVGEVHCSAAHARIWAEDYNGNICSDTNIFGIDNAPPVTTKDWGEPYVLCDEEDPTHCKLYVTPATEFTLSAVEIDPDTGKPCGIGVNNTYYQINEGPIYIYDGPFTLPAGCEQNLSYWSDDLVINIENHHIQIDNVDDVPPETVKDFDGPTHDREEGDNYYVDVGTVVILHAEDQSPEDDACPVGVDHLYYEIWWDSDGDGVAYDDYLIDSGYDYDGHFEYTFDRESIHEIRWYAVDKLGNIEQMHVQEHAVDDTAPIIKKTVIGEQFGDCPPASACEEWCQIDGNTTIKVEAWDPDPHPVDHVTCDWWYTVNGGDRIFGGIGVGTPFIIDFPEECEHALYIVCKDALENTEEDGPEIFIVDETKPVTDKWYEGAQYPVEGYPKWIKTNTSVVLRAYDPEPHPSGIRVTYWRNTRVDDVFCRDQELCYFEAQGSGPWNVYEGPFTKDEESCHLIEYYSVDKVGKTEEVKKQCVFVEDTAPEVSKELEGPKVQAIGDEWDPSMPYDIMDQAWYINQDTRIHLYCDDPQPHPVDDVTIYYKYFVDGEPWTKGWYVYEGPFTYEEDTFHELYYYCVDALGNAGPVHYELDIVDSQPPDFGKVVGDPKVECGDEPCDYYITRETPINIYCEDHGQHPVDDVTIEYRYRYKVDWQDQWSEWSPWVEVNDAQTRFTFNEDSIHELEYVCHDSLGNAFESRFEVDVVDTQPPETEKNLDGPAVECSADEKAHYQYGDCAYVTQDTWVSLECEDPLPHPVDDVTLYYEIYWRENWGDEWELIDDGSTDGELGFYYEEDSFHLLSWYCEDALGNEEQKHNELDMVDTQAPEIIKEVVGPQIGACPGPMPEEFETESCEKWDCLTDLEKDFFTTGRYGANNPTGAWELAIWEYDGGEYVVDEDHYVWTKGQEVDFSLSYDPSDGSVVYVLDDKTLTWTYDTGMAFEYIIPFAKGNTNGNHVELTDMELNGVPIDDVSSGSTYMGLKVALSDAHQVYGFTLTGKAKLTWDVIPKDEIPGFHIFVMNTHEPEPCIIDGVTLIHVETLDPEPHPVDDVECTWWYTLLDIQGGGKGADVPPFDINFPEESIHELYIECEDALGNSYTDGPEVFIVDKTPPETTKVYGEPIYPPVEGYPKWITTHTPVFMRALDPEPHPSGVNVTYWRNSLVDDIFCWDPQICQVAEGYGEWNVYTEPFFKEEESCHLIEYYSVDNVDKTEEVKKQCVFVDDTAPTVWKEVGEPKVKAIGDEWTPTASYDIEDGAWYITQQTPISLYCEDRGDHPVDHETIYYKYYVNGQPVTGWEEYEGPFTYPQDSYHELYYYCVDILGNIGPVHYELDIVDTLPPETEKEVIGENKIWIGNEVDWLIDDEAEIVLTCEDPEPHPVDAVTIYWSTRWSYLGEVWTEWTEPMVYSGPISFDESSYHEIEYWCVDALGNEEKHHFELDAVDLDPPETEKTVGEPKVDMEDGYDYWITQQTPISMRCLDPEPHPSGVDEIWYRYYLDGELEQDWTIYEGPIYFDEDSVHELEYYCVDNFGNEEEHQFELDNVDTAPPEIEKYVRVNDGNRIYSQEEPIYIGGDDKVKFCAEVWDVKQTHNEHDPGVGILEVFGRTDPLDDPEMFWDEEEEAYCFEREAQYEECGRWHYEVMARDYLGNEAEWEDGLEIIVDNAPPIGEVLNPHAGQYYRDGKPFAMYMPVIDFGGNSCESDCIIDQLGCFFDNHDCPASGVEYCTFYAVDYNFEGIDQSNVKDLWDYLEELYIMGITPNWVELGTLEAEVEGNEVICKGQLMLPPDSGMTDTVFMWVDIVDKVGNKYSWLALNPWLSPITMNIDNDGPGVFITEMGDLPGPLTSGDVVMVQAEVDEYQSGFDACWADIYTDDEGEPDEDTGYDIAGTARDYNLCEISGILPEGLESGRYYLKVNARDEQFNIGYDWALMMVDNDRPSMGIISPEMNEVYSDMLPVSLFIEDENSGIAEETVMFRVSEIPAMGNLFCLFSICEDTGWISLEEWDDGVYAETINVTEHGITGQGGRYVFDAVACDELYVPEEDTELGFSLGNSRTDMHCRMISVHDSVETEERPECSDGIDNDFDGYIDYIEDEECYGPMDDTEDYVEQID